jgi:hypothetical protein
MNRIKLFSLAAVLLCAASASAQLAVTVTPPKVVGQKAVVQLKMKNQLAAKVESARAVCFLLDEQGRMVGQSTKWVIGGSQDKAGLAAAASRTFNFVVSSPQPWTTTNLTAKISFSRVVLSGGKLADVQRDVTVKVAD